MTLVTDMPTEISKEGLFNKEDPWTLIESYFTGQHLAKLVRHQLESYNDFVNYQLQKTIDMFNPVQIHSEHDYDAKSKKYQLEIFITFETFHIYRPQIHENNGATKLMFPHEARLRNFTYASSMTVDINIKYVIRSGTDLQHCQTICKTLPKIHIGKLPIMLRSSICVLNQYKHVTHATTGECEVDPGGYFIINGTEKTVLGQERAAENRIYCFNVSKGNNKWSYMAEIKSVPDFKCISPKQINMMITSKNNGFGFPIQVQIPRIKQPIPLFIVFRALGITSDKEICERIVLDIKDTQYKKIMYGLQASIVEANKVLTQEAAINYIVAFAMFTPINMDKDIGLIKKREFTLDVLRNDLFPHCPTEVEKKYFLGYMANKLLKCSFEWIPTDDRDCYTNKRVDLTGALLNNLFRNYFNKLVKDMQKQIIREVNNGSWRSTDDYSNIINLTNIYKIIKSTTIENGIKRALATGDFGIKHTNSNKVGVAQVLNRLTYISSLSHLRRINTPIDKSGKLIPPRKLHNSSWGFLCPAETPEGQSVGVVKNLSYMTHVTIPSNTSAIHDYIKPYMIYLKDVEYPVELHGHVKVFINGCWLGITKDPLNLYESLKNKKSQGIINIYTSVIFDYKSQEIKVCNDGGRLIRPVLRLNNGRIALTDTILMDLKEMKLRWDDLFINCRIDNTVLEYIDPEEQNYLMIAMDDKTLQTKTTGIIYKYTHCEIHPSTIFGILASCIPFPEHNQSPRNTYQCIDSEEYVRMHNGTHKKIKDIVNGDRVLTFSPDNNDITSTSVVSHINRFTDKKIYEIETISGKRIKATFDHKFMTYNGWKEVGDLDIKRDTLAICTTPIIENIEKHQGAITMEVLEENTNIKLNNKDLIRLREKNLINICYNNYKLKLIAKIFGFVITDGSINIYEKGPMLQCNFTSINSADEFENDIELLGFNKCKISRSIRTFNNVTHRTWKVIHGGLLAKYFLALNITAGKRTCNNHNPLPGWIKNEDNIIRCFLSGYFGGDGCRIRYNKIKSGHNYICAPLQITKNQEYMENGMNFMEDIKYCLNKLFIKTKEVTCKPNKDQYIIQLALSCEQDNLIKIFENIGYAYDYHKQISSAKVINYLKYKKIKQKEYFEETGRKYFHLREFTPRNLVDTVDTRGIMLYEKIHNIKEVKDASVMVSDITTESKNQSFIMTKGFCIHNCAMGKQAMGMYVTNFDKRMDKTSYVLTYPMRPLVDTRVMNIIELNRIPSGLSVIVAIMTHSGYNQEDSLMFNQGSIDRGLFQATIYHTEKDEDKKIHGDEEIRCKPDCSKTKGIKFGNYKKLSSRGVIPENTLVENGDVIIGKVIPIKENRNDHTKLIKYEDQSRSYRTMEESYIDKNYIDRNGDGYNFCKVRIRTMRKPVIGDKFSSRHGQKGTIGNIIPECDMPFTANGVRPDIIINPHAIPSRMTIGQLKETLLGKVLIELGLFGDGTSFNDLSIENISEELLNLGYESYGNELMYDGLTGVQIESDIFMGPAFYQRLKHMVNDKQHSRSIGPMVNLTRQPAEGRSRDGGLRFGEMERDCMISHGASRFTKGRIYDASDHFHVYVCKCCGMTAAFNNKCKIHHCKTCDNRVAFAYVEIPYACKLQFQELITMNIAPRMITN